MPYLGRDMRNGCVEGRELLLLREVVVPLAGVRDEGETTQAVQVVGRQVLRVSCHRSSHLGLAGPHVLRQHGHVVLVEFCKGVGP